jgi:small GTP-binding protein
MSEVMQKVVLFLLGDSSVGKTSFLNRYANNIYRDICPPTIGIDSFSRKLAMPTGEYIYLVLYDTAGQEKYRSISFNLIKGAEGILLMYDITDRRTFEDINRWIEDIKDIKGDGFPIILIGNKIDLNERRVVSEEEGQKIADDNGFCFIETSCKEGINIEESMNTILLKIKVSQENSIKSEEKEYYSDIDIKTSFAITEKSSSIKVRKTGCCK